MNNNQPVHNAMNHIHWQQIKKYLKISDLRSEKDFKDPNWYIKIEPIYNDFLGANKRYYIPGQDAFIDELLVLFKSRSGYTMLIFSKQTGKIFKIHSLFYNNYMISIMFSSQAFKIDGLKWLLGFINSSSMVAQICQFLPNYEKLQPVSGLQNKLFL